MNTVSYTKESLHAFITSEAYDQLSNVPISKHRALSQIANPMAQDSDIILVAAYDQQKTVGYLGALPEDMLIKGQSHHIGWLTCFWVDDAYKNQNVAASLFLRMIRAWKKEIFITNIVPWLEPIYQKTGIFHPTSYVNGHRAWIRSNFAHILPPKAPWLLRVKPILTALDSGLNLLHDIRLVGYKPESPILATLHTTFDDASQDFIARSSASNYSQRGVADLIWIKDNPWLIPSPDNQRYKSRYYFSAISDHFSTQVVKVHNGKTLVGAGLLNIRDKHWTLPYAYYSNATDFLNAIITLIVEHKGCMLTLYNSELSAQLARTNHRGVYFKKNIKKPFFISKNLDEGTEPLFQDGDGDCAFY